MAGEPVHYGAAPEESIGFIKDLHDTVPSVLSGHVHPVRRETRGTRARARRARRGAGPARAGAVKRGGAAGAGERRRGAGDASVGNRVVLGLFDCSSHGGEESL